MQAHQPARIGRQRPPVPRVVGAHLWARADHPEYAGFGDISVRTAGPCGYAINASLRRLVCAVSLAPMRSIGLAMSDATDRSPLHSGTKPGTKGGSRRCKARYKARYTAAQGGTKQDVQLCCQGVCGAEAKQLCGRSQTSRGGGLRWQVPQAVRTLEPARGWWQRTPRVAVPAYRPLSLAGIVHTIRRSSYAALPRAFSGR